MTDFCFTDFCCEKATLPSEAALHVSVIAVQQFAPLRAGWPCAASGDRTEEANPGVKIVKWYGFFPCRLKTESLCSAFKTRSSLYHL